MSHLPDQIPLVHAGSEKERAFGDPTHGEAWISEEDFVLADRMEFSDFTKFKAITQFKLYTAMFIKQKQSSNFLKHEKFTNVLVFRKSTLKVVQSFIYDNVF